jgi:TATA-box binding protein (TBP) (component of TFIID and TFIIIB)
MKFKNIEIWEKPDTFHCDKFGTIKITQNIPFEKYVNELKERTNWVEGEDILPIISNYVMNMAFKNNFTYRLKDLSLSLSNIYYNPEEFAAPTIRNNVTACLSFPNSKLVITGGKSEENVRYSSYQYKRQLMQVQHLVKVLNEDDTPMLVTEDELIQPGSDCPIPARTRPSVKKQVYSMTTMDKMLDIEDFNLVNVVGSGLGSKQPIDLSLILRIMTTTSEWEPAFFPGLKFIVFKKYCPIKNPQCTAHIFDTGSIVIMGATCVQDVINCFLFLKCVVKYFLDRPYFNDNEFSKFQYRINKVNETRSLARLPASEKFNLEKQILEECSRKCFGDYITTDNQSDAMRNPFELKKTITDNLSAISKINDMKLMGLSAGESKRVYQRFKRNTNFDSEQPTKKQKVSDVKKVDLFFNNIDL